jgi:hypothetical protein
MMKAFRRFLDSPYTNLVIASFLFCSGLSEAWESLASEFEYSGLRVHHGILVFSIFHILKCLHQIFENLDRVRSKKACPIDR